MASTVFILKWQKGKREDEVKLKLEEGMKRLKIWGVWGMIYWMRGGRVE